jgi:hypothetical protein
MGVGAADIASAHAHGASGGGGDDSTCGLDAATLRRRVASAVAMLGSRKPAKQEAATATLGAIAYSAQDNNHQRYDFQAVVVASGGIPLLVRVGRGTWTPLRGTPRASPLTSR